MTEMKTLTIGGTTYEVVDAVARNLIAQLSKSTISEVKLFANKWVSKGNLHSQVVTIDGITSNSQVDLTPSVDQLVIFYDKSFMLTTENNDGVVTVYAIGQKPTNDYTIQVTITEVVK